MCDARCAKGAMFAERCWFFEETGASWQLLLFDKELKPEFQYHHTGIDLIPTSVSILSTSTLNSCPASCTEFEVAKCCGQGIFLMNALHQTKSSAQLHWLSIYFLAHASLVHPPMAPLAPLHVRPQHELCLGASAGWFPTRWLALHCNPPPPCDHF